jgi:lipoprotein-anchoring transpeptidase ErfK/SrfK
VPVGSRVAQLLFALLLLIATAFAVQPKGKARSKAVRPVAQVNFDPAAVNQGSEAPPLHEKDAGSAVLRAQILLDRAGLSVGEMDGHVGSNMVHAILGIRATHGLPAEPSIDESVWKILNADAGPVLTAYTTSADDFKGPFEKVPADMMRKAKLKHLGYASPLEGIAEKFHIQPALLQKLNPGRSFQKAGEELTVPNVRNPVTGMAARIIVSKHDSIVQVFDMDGKLLAQYPCTTGSEHDPLPIGEWKVTAVYRNPKFHYNPKLFWDAKAKDGPATIAPGPRNPVGLVWIDLSKEHYGIHGTPAPGAIGHTESHGCIRLTNWDALELAGMVTTGTPVSLVE